MRSVLLHTFVLAALLVVVGAGSILYQVYVQGVPLTASETDPVWVVDAKINFRAKENSPVKVRMFVPPILGAYGVLDEHFIGKNYGVNVAPEGDNRLATWSARRAGGAQEIYYRLVLPQRPSAAPPSGAGPQFRDTEVLTGPKKLAAESLIEPIRQQSADVETFIREAIKRVNDTDDDNVRLLLEGDFSVTQRARVVATILSHAHIPVEPVHTLRLSKEGSQSPELWLRSFNGDTWLYLNPDTGATGLPADRLVWWAGSDPLLRVTGGTRSSVSFSVSRNEMNAIALAQRTTAAIGGVSLYNLPLQSQQTFRVMMMIPYGVLLILILRGVVGLETLGTFTPILIALAFRETDLAAGIFFFTLIVALGLSVRKYMENLHLQLLSRLSVVLTFVVIAMLAISVLSYKLGMGSGLSIALFPMVILTMVIERMSILWEERGGMSSLKTGVGTLIAATFGHLLMTIDWLMYFTFTFPGILLVLSAVMLAMGHYRGYRLTELIRFRELMVKSS